MGKLADSQPFNYRAERHPHVRHSADKPWPPAAAAAERAAEAEHNLTQDPARYSWRVWGAVWAVLAGALSLPEVQQAITVALGAAVPVAYAPLVPGILAVIWPLVSKYKDTRPVRGAQP